MAAVEVGQRFPRSYEPRGDRGGIRARGADVLFARITPCLENGKVAQLPLDQGPTGGSTEFIVIRPSRLIDPGFLYYWCLSPHVRQLAEARMTGTTGRMRLAPRDLADVPFRFPDLPSQRRIVQLIEDHLSRLDAAQASIHLAHDLTVALVQAALARAASGRLVALSQLASIQGGIQKTPARTPKTQPRPFLRVANVTKFGLDLAEVHCIEATDDEVRRLALAKGDLLVVEGNGSPAQIGRAALWDGSIKDCLHQNHLIRVRAYPGLIPEYLEIAWNSPGSRRHLTQVASSTSGLHTLSVRKLAQLELPVPALVDQESAVLEVRAIREAQQRLTKSIDAALSRSMVLERAVLAAAFSGRLTGSASDAEIIEETAARAD